MKIKFIVPIVFSVLFFSACKKDFFDATVAVEVPEHKPSLAVTSEMYAGDSVIAVYVSKSVGILEELDETVIKDATVELFKNGQPYATVPYFETEFFESSFYLLELDEAFSFDASEYELRVSAPGLDPVTAKQEMPTAVEIISVKYEAEGAVNVDGERVDEFSIEFNDPAGVENFYVVEIWLEPKEGSFGSTQMLYLENLDLLAEEFYPGLYLKDNTFDGKKHTWRVGVYPYFGNTENPNFRVELYSVTRDKYLFARSVSLFDEANDNPFAEPVIVHGNVVGGNGVFSLGTKDVEIVVP